MDGLIQLQVPVLAFVLVCWGFFSNIGFIFTSLVVLLSLLASGSRNCLIALVIQDLVPKCSEHYK